MDEHLSILSIQPTMIAVADGTWLAIAGPGAGVRVGVVEPTQAQARLRFGEALHRVAEVLGQVDE
jgi:hypothetical protein